MSLSSKGVRANFFSTKSNQLRSPASLIMSEDKENSCLFYVKAQGRDPSNPPIKFNTSQ